MPVPIYYTPPVTVPSLLTNPSKITSPTAAVTVAAAPRPAYLQPLLLAGYGTKITRIGGDYGTPLAIGGTWGKVALHHYSKDQPWNDDLSMIYIEQRKDLAGNYPPNSPTKLILDGKSYLPIIGNKNCSNSNNNNGLLNNCGFTSGGGEVRWRPGHPDQMIGWNSTNQILTVFRLVSQEVLYRVHIPSACVQTSSNDGFGLLSEGVISDDGNLVVLCSHWIQPQRVGSIDAGKTDHFCVVNIAAGIAGTHYANAASTSEFGWAGAGVGPMNFFTMPYLTRDYGDIDWASISPLGAFVVVKYSSTDTPEYARCFDVDPATLVCAPRTFLTGDNPLFSGGPVAATPDDFTGWMACGSHGDFRISDAAVDFGQAGPEVYICGMRESDTANHCSDADVAALGHYIAQSMVTGAHVHISKGTTGLGGATETADQHTSGRCYKTPTKMLATYEYHATNKFADELVLWGVTSSGNPVRCGTTRTDDSNYLGEAHGVPSPGCEKIMFASNWQRNAAPAGPVDDFKSYVLEATGMEGAPAATYTRRAEAPLVINLPATYLDE